MDKAFEDWKARQPHCPDCNMWLGSPVKPHAEDCPHYVHIVDDHYDSACMRGTCRHCHPEYVAPIHMRVSADEQQLILKLRDPGSSFGSIMGLLKKVSNYFF